MASHDYALGSLLKRPFVRFLIVGCASAGLNLGVTWLLTTFVFGLEHYFLAYLCGIAVTLVFSFTLFTVAIFKTKTRHMRRFVIFIIYGIGMSAVQASVVKFVTGAVGLRWYLAVITGTILLFSVINFFAFKLSIFRETAPSATH